MLKGAPTKLVFWYLLNSRGELIIFNKYHVKRYQWQSSMPAKHICTQTSDFLKSD